MSQPKPPHFSIITAVWNRAATVHQAVQSLTAQHFEHFEHIVQDGGSSDGTLAVLEALADPRMKVRSEPDGGIYDALNRALVRCSGQIIGLLHSDDFYAHADVLGDVAQRFDETGADAVYGDLDYVSASDPARIVRRWRAGEFRPSDLRRGWMPPHPALFLRRSVVDRLGGFDTDFEIAADYDAILRYFGSGSISASYLPQVLVKMRLGGASNRSLGRVLLKSREDYRALRKNGVGGIGTVVCKNLRKVAQFYPAG